MRRFPESSKQYVVSSKGIILLTFLLTAYYLLPTTTSSYTSPGNPTGFVNDFAGILSPTTVSELNQKLSAFSESTGNEISVVTITKLEDETIETYAEKLFQEWGIGKEKEDNGLLLLVSLEDREMRIDVGYGLEPVITDIDSGRIIREIITPAFQAGDFDKGITEGVNAITGLIGGESLPEESSPNWGGWSQFFPFIIFIISFLVAILARSKSWWAGGIVGGILGAIFFSTIIATGIAVLIGLLFDFVVSRAYQKSKKDGGTPPWWIGGGGFGGGSSGGGFSGFGGGMSGGGGASGKW